MKHFYVIIWYELEDVFFFGKSECSLHLSSLRQAVIFSEANILSLPWAVSPSDVDKILGKKCFDFSMGLLVFAPENPVFQFESN